MKNKVTTPFEVGKLYIQSNDPTATQATRIVVRCTADKYTGFAGEVIRGCDPRIFTRGEIFNHFSKAAFEPYDANETKALDNISIDC